MEFPESTLSSDTVFKSRVFTVRRDKVSSQGRKYFRDVVVHKGAVAIVPLLSNSTILLIKQFRYSVRQFLVEVPAGTLELGEEPEDCAARELTEETGYRAQSLDKLAYFFVAPGYSTEEMHVFLARNLQPLRPNREMDEHIALLPVTIDEAFEMVRRGEIKDAKTLVALFYVKQHLASKHIG